MELLAFAAAVLVVLGAPALAAVVWQRSQESPADSIELVAVAYGGIAVAALSLWSMALLLGLTWRAVVLGSLVGAAVLVAPALARLKKRLEPGVDDVDAPVPTGQHDGRVVSNFVVQALLGEPLTVYGDGGQTRSFCYVSDLVDGILRLFHSEEPDPTNIGNPNEFTVLQLAEEVLRLTGSSSTIEKHPLPTDDPKVRRPDITKARKVLQWEPEVTLVDGLQRTIDYFKGRL